MHKFFIEEGNIENDIAVITGDDVKHIYKVLRLKEDDIVYVNNCKGKEFKGKLIDVNKKGVKVELIEELSINNESNVEVYLYQGAPKAAKMDLISQKCTELGIKEIIPVITKRVEPGTEKSLAKTDRWNRIALEACKQSKRSVIPEIREAIDFKDMLEELKDKDLVIVAYENKENFGLRSLFSKINKEEVKSVAIVVGPEGGFEESEIEVLEKNRAHIVTLGKRILRTETAGFTAVGIVMYELGDLGGEI